ncbi:ABC transporter substrate-binding protein [Paenibacillus sp. S150]|uniref:ABC transporter substrate-binding protein n=1 Tax=Paenibacillus sp. S150 TaxID=2749826 RepID=UPI001C59F6BA|nr:hypothetical protein [Paenibacillus sp. S150]MBW4082556.1 ABC transporter substrate-binding protein [Paenibacillus sp. S150]
MSNILTKVSEIHYTICPVGNTSYIAANKGWLKEGLNKLDVEPVRLQTLEQPLWKSHFDYQNPLLFREGGNIPPIWAKSNGAEVVLIGLTLLEQKQYLLARADSPLESPEQLEKYKIGIPSHPSALIDFHKASAEHGFEIALAARGLAGYSGSFVELIAEGDFVSSSPEKKRELGSREVEALDSGEVDVIYVKGTKVQRLLDTGKYKVIFEISSNPGHLLPVNNEYPNVLTVSRLLAEDHPEIVVAYLKQLLLAAEWAKTHRSEVLDLFAEQTYGTPGQVAASHSFDFHKRLAPGFSGQGLLALEGQKRFLYDHGYITEDFDLAGWADDRFLKAALSEIEREQQYGGE